jgi:hypothetical protein
MGDVRPLFKNQDGPADVVAKIIVELTRAGQAIEAIQGTIEPIHVEALQVVVDRWQMKLMAITMALQAQQALAELRGLIL